MEREKKTPHKRTSKLGATWAARRKAPLLIGVLLLLGSCGRQEEGPLPPHSPPRPTTMHGADLIHAHYQLPARPVPPLPGMM